MALAISTGFVVDDAIVVLENVTRYLEQGVAPVSAAYRGAREIGFTVLSMSTSLVAVFIPILLMRGLVGRLFREFAVTLSIAIGMSLAVSLTTTPAMCAQLLKPLFAWPLPMTGTRYAVLSGNIAMAMGGAAAVVKFYCAYPMSPSTGVLHWASLSQRPVNNRSTRPLVPCPAL